MDEDVEPEEPKQSFYKNKKILIIAGVVLALIIALGTIWLVSRGPVEEQASQPAQQAITDQLSEAEKAGQILSGGQCEGTGFKKLSSPPMKMEDFEIIIPYGLMIDSHVTPIDHQYFSPADYDSPRDAYEVRAMGDATITEIGHRYIPGGENPTDEYRLVFTQSCTFFYYYDLVTSLSPELKAAFDKAAGGTRSASMNYPVKAGDLIGRIGGQTLDFAVWDTTKPLTGFVRPEHYESEPWKVYTADPLDYYTDELKAKLVPRHIRSIKPISGKIDHDQPGKLIGNWFVKGSNGYGGTNQSEYWKTHLSFAPDHVDPKGILVSIGDYNGKAAQFAVKNNTPNPAEVSAQDGLVKYELVQIEYFKPDGAHWDRFSLVKGLRMKPGPQAEVLGTVLVQVFPDNQIKFEAFPGKTASQASGFTDAAKIYER